MPFRSSLALTALAAACAVLAGPVHAADAVKAKSEATLGSGKGSGPYLTRDQLRDCFARQDKLRADDAELVKEQAAVKVDQDTQKQDGEEMKARLEAVDRTNPESVAAYNEQVEARNQRLQALQTRIDAFNDRVQANQVLHAEFGPACSNRRYFDEDAAALKKGR